MQTLQKWMKLVDPKRNDRQAISSGDFKRTFAVGLRYKGLRNLVYICWVLVCVIVWILAKPQKSEMRVSEKKSEVRELGNVRGPMRKFRIRKARVTLRVIGGNYPRLVSSLNSQLLITHSHSSLSIIFYLLLVLLLFATFVPFLSIYVLMYTILVKGDHFSFLSLLLLLFGAQAFC